MRRMPMIDQRDVCKGHLFRIFKRCWWHRGQGRRLQPGTRPLYEGAVEQVRLKTRASVIVSGCSWEGKEGVRGVQAGIVKDRIVSAVAYGDSGEDELYEREIEVSS